MSCVICHVSCIVVHLVQVEAPYLINTPSSFPPSFHRHYRHYRHLYHHRRHHQSMQDMQTLHKNGQTKIALLEGRCTDQERASEAASEHLCQVCVFVVYFFK